MGYNYNRKFGTSLAEVEIFMDDDSTDDTYLI
jgi:hypothetical protein